MQKLWKKVRDFGRAESGAVMIEFAAVMVVIMILIFPTIDFARYILLQQKTIKTAHTIADSLALSAPVMAGTTADEITQLHMSENAVLAVLDPAIIDALMSPFPAEGAGGVADRYNVVVTHVHNDSGSPRISWQYDANSLALNSVAESEIGIGRDADANLPGSIANGFGDLDFNENVIVVEAMALYQPITPGMQSIGIPFLDQTTVKHTAYFPGRNGQLGCLWPHYLAPFDCVDGS